MKVTVFRDVAPCSLLDVQTAQHPVRQSYPDLLIV
jgi:hypothetical protein